MSFSRQTRALIKISPNGWHKSRERCAPTVKMSLAGRPSRARAVAAVVIVVSAVVLLVQLSGGSSSTPGRRVRGRRATLPPEDAVASASVKPAPPASFAVMTKGHGAKSDPIEWCAAVVRFFVPSF